MMLCYAGKSIEFKLINHVREVTASRKGQGWCNEAIFGRLARLGFNNRNTCGEVAERLNALVLKTSKG